MNDLPMSADLRDGLRKLQAAIRTHRDNRGDDRCWLDDEALYAVLPEGYTVPARDTAVELERCRQYIASRQNPQTEYVSPQREIERLQLLLIRKNEALAVFADARMWGRFQYQETSFRTWRGINEFLDPMAFAKQCKEIG